MYLTGGTSSLLALRRFRQVLRQTPGAQVRHAVRTSTVPEVPRWVRYLDFLHVPGHKVFDHSVDTGLIPGRVHAAILRARDGAAGTVIGKAPRAFSKGQGDLASGSLS